MVDGPVDITLHQNDGRKPAWPARPALEIALCVVGSALSTFTAPIGVLLMVAGLLLLRRPQEGKKTWMGVVGCLVPLLAYSVFDFVNYGSLSVMPVALALAMAFVLPGRIGITSACLCAVGAGALSLAMDAAVLAAYGWTILEYVEETFDALAEELSSVSVSGVSVTAIVDQSISLMRSIWPLSYLIQGAMSMLLGLVVFVIVRRYSARSLYEAFVRYDMPIWGMVLIVVTVVCWAASSCDFAYADTFLSGALCLFICLRVLYFLQGIAVAMSLMDKRGFGPFARIMIIVLLLMLEANFYVVCVFGAIDAWANFRKLERKDERREVPQIESGEDANR